MKFLLTSFILLVFTYIVNAQLWLVDPLESIYPDVNQLSTYNNKWRGDYPQGTVADVHLVVKIPIGETFTLSTLMNGKNIDLHVWSQLIAVPVEQNTGLDSRTEQYINQINPHVIRRAPFKIFEVIKPLENNISLKSNTNYTAFRLSIPPRLLPNPGTYKININLRSKKISKKGNFTIKVYDTQLPTLSESKFFYTNWFNLTQMEEKHQMKRWTEPWFQMLSKYASLMAHGRQNSITIPKELIYIEDERVILKEEKMLRFIDVFKKHGFQYFEAPHLMYRGDDDDWSNPDLVVVLTKRKYYEENGKEDIKKLITKIKEFVIRNKLSGSWLQHIADEPTSANAACYRDVAKQIKQIYPEIIIMEATNNKEDIAGSVDIWCPLINDFQENEAFFREREKLGEQVLVYTCLIPGGKWLNRTLDMEKLRQVYFGWGAAYYGTKGYLHWGLNQYHADPYEQSVIKHPSPQATPNNFLPAGDTHIIYPGKKGPLSSIRFEAHRMGCEDYELLEKLKDRNADLYHKLIHKLFRSYTNYNLRLEDYRKTRKHLLHSLAQ